MPLCGPATSIVTQRRMERNLGETRSLNNPHAPKERLKGLVQPPEHAAAGSDGNLALAALVSCTQWR